MRPLYFISILLLCFYTTCTFCAKPEVIAYYTNWARWRTCGSYLPEHVNPIASKLTHLNWAFLKFDAQGNVLPVEPSDCAVGTWATCDAQPGQSMFERIKQVQKAHPNMKLTISLGGWSWGGTLVCPTFRAVASSAESRTRLVTQTIQFAQKFGFEGIDYDWEYPGYEENGCGPGDADNFVKLAREFKEKAPANFIFTSAIAAAPSILDKSEPWKLLPYLDYLLVMTYDYHVSSEKKAAFNSPLRDEVKGAKWSITSTVEHLLSKGVPPSKLVLGLATYGHSWNAAESSKPIGPLCDVDGPGAAGRCTVQAGWLSYYEIQELMNQPGAVTVYNTTVECPYTYAASGNPWVSYDNPRSLRAKVKYAKEKKLAGVMFWSLDYDEFANGKYPLINAAVDELNK